MIDPPVPGAVPPAPVVPPVPGEPPDATGGSVADEQLASIVATPTAANVVEAKETNRIFIVSS
jgi:hypothetical protein